MNILSSRIFGRWIALVLITLTTACASTSYKKIVLNDGDFTGKPLVRINDVPYVEQQPKYCGPSALYMVTKPYQPNLSLEEVSELTMTPSASGTYKQDMLSATRRMKMAPYLVPKFSGIIDYLAEGTPVIIFHRTKFLWKNFWHYSVLTGYDRPNETFTLHIGPYQNHVASMSDVVGSWEEGGSWAFVVMPPQKIPENIPILEALDNSLAFLRLGYVEEAYLLSLEMIKRWPDRYEGNVVLGEALLRKNEKREAIKVLKEALRKNPEHPTLKQKIAELSKSAQS